MARKSSRFCPTTRSSLWISASFSRRPRSCFSKEELSDEERSLICLPMRAIWNLYSSYASLKFRRILASSFSTLSPPRVCSSVAANRERSSASVARSRHRATSASRSSLSRLPSTLLSPLSFNLRVSSSFLARSSKSSLSRRVVSSQMEDFCRKSMSYLISQSSARRSRSLARLSSSPIVRMSYSSRSALRRQKSASQRVGERARESGDARRGEAGLGEVAYIQNSAICFLTDNNRAVSVRWVVLRLRSYLQFEGMSEEENCCACGNVFADGSNPRMMPACGHNACTTCLRQLLGKGQAKELTCRHCGHRETLAGVDLEYFPKNIGLIKRLRERTNVPKPAPQAEDSSFSVGSQPEKELCPLHGKELQLVCLTDRTRLCAHCALFGSHKDHRFKTVRQATEQMAQTKMQFQNYRSRKAELDLRLSSSEFREGVVRKITTEKDRLVGEIKRRFEEITENVRMAEKKAYEEVVKNFKTVYAKITALMKEENDSQRRFKQWEAKCSELFQKAERLGSIEEKVGVYCGGPLEICSEGETLLSRLESKINTNIATIEVLISQIRVVENAGVSNSVFNFINVVLDDNEPLEGLPYVQQEVLSPRSFKEEKQQKIESAANHLSSTREHLLLNRESLSPAVKKKSKSKDRLANSDKRPNREFASPERSSVSALIDEFCEKENLDTLDLTGYGLNDNEIYEVLAYLRPVKKVKGLKLVKNRLSNEGLGRIIELIPSVTNINLSFNQLSDEAITMLLAGRSRISSLRIINLSNNKINERKTKNAIDELKKQGVIVTL